MTLIEVMIACTVTALGSLAALGTLTTTAALDEELALRSVALRGAMSRMETVLGYDYGGDLGELVTHWTAPALATFDVDGLAAAADDPNAKAGAITFDATDPERVAVTVTVSWRGRLGVRSLSLPMIVTEIAE